MNLLLLSVLLIQY